MENTSNTISKDVESLLQKKYELYDNIIELNELEKIYKKEIKKIELKIFDNCIHSWIRDLGCAFDDPIKHVCEKCGLWKRRSLYTDEL